MLKVLLVDDEPFILKGLSMVIDWEAEGFEIAGMASNGQEALGVFSRESVDLVIADIKMPGMNGLELLEKLREMGASDLYFVILSGYSDFEYARRALQNECLDYILKPVRKEELLPLLYRVRRMHEVTVQKNLENSQREKECFTRNVIPILYGKYDSANVEYVKRFLGEGKGARYIGIDLDMSRRKIQEIAEDGKKAMQRELYRKCLFLLKDHPYNCVFDISGKEECYDVGIIFTDDLLEGTKLTEQEYLEKLHGELKSSVDFPFSFLIGNKVGKLESLVESYRTLMVVRSFKRLESIEENRKGDEQDWELSEKKIDKQKLDLLVDAVEQNNKAGIKKGIQDIFFMKVVTYSDTKCTPHRPFV